MATGGWGAMGAAGGAWGTAPQPPPDDDSPRAPAAAAPAPAPAPKQPAFGSSFRANPVAEPTPASYAPQQSSNNTFGLFGGGTSAGSGRPMTESELRKKEAELNEREKRIKEQEQQLGVAVAKKPNWPICYPVWRHNIAEDIPDKSKRVVREAYLCWWFLLGALSYQFFCGSVMLGYSAAGSQKVPSWFLTIIYWLAGVPGSIFLWYKRLYSAAASDSTFSFLTFFFWFFLHWAFCVWCAIGVQINAAKWSFAGFIAGIDAFNVNTFAGTIYMIGGGIWSAVALYSMWVLKDTWHFWRGRGGATEVKQKQQQEAALAAFTQQQGAGHASNRV